MKRCTAILILLCAVATLSAAHGKQMLGTITQLSETEITIETRTKEIKVFQLTPQTVYLKSGATARFQDLKVGERVFLHYKEAAGKLEALEVIFGPTKPKPPKKST